jgi:hypothetical protein
MCGIAKGGGRLKFGSVGREQLQWRHVLGAVEQGANIASGVGDY